jgi:hypothetical protein
MPQKTQGTILSVATAQGSTKVITAITAAAPPQVTSSTHGQANGSVGIITTVVGMTQVNNRAFVVGATATNTFELRGDDGTGYTAYSSGGIWTPQTMTAIGEVQGVPELFTGESSELDGTHLGSSAKEFFLGLQDPGGGTLNLFLPSTVDTGQTKLRYLRKYATSAAFLLTLPSGQVCAFVAYVKSFVMSDITPDGLVKATVALRLANEPGSGIPT